MKHKKHHSPQYDDMKADRKMGMMGVEQGDMSPHVSDYQKPKACFAEEGFSKTLEYIERQDKHQEMAAHDIKKQHYMGRYS
jgi:hypothetical protein